MKKHILSITLCVSALQMESLFGANRRIHHPLEVPILSEKSPLLEVRVTQESPEKTVLTTQRLFQKNRPMTTIQKTTLSLPTNPYTGNKIYMFHAKPKTDEMTPHQKDLDAFSRIQDDQVQKYNPHVMLNQAELTNKHYRLHNDINGRINDIADVLAVRTKESPDPITDYHVMNRIIDVFQLMREQGTLVHKLGQDHYIDGKISKGDKNYEALKSYNDNLIRLHEVFFANKCFSDLINQEMPKLKNIPKKPTDEEKEILTANLDYIDKRITILYAMSKLNSLIPENIAHSQWATTPLKERIKQLRKVRVQLGKCIGGEVEMRVKNNEALLTKSMKKTELKSDMNFQRGTHVGYFTIIYMLAVAATIGSILDLLITAY